MKKYRVKITEIDGEDKKVLLDEDFSSVVMLNMGTDEKTIGEVVINDSVVNLAFKISQSHHIIKAAEIAVGFNKIKDELKKDLEDILADSIRKGE